MGVPTGKVLKVLRATGRGSDYFGACDQCGKHASEIFVYQSRREWERENGEFYTSPIGGGAHGHRECLIKFFGEPDVERNR